jgi:ABC-2 type transport system permease protein
MRFVAIASKALKERFRDRNGLAMQLLFPAVFMLVFGLAFSSGGVGKSRPYEILVINDDAGTLDQQGMMHSYGEELLDLLADATYQNSTTKLFTLANATEDDARELLTDREVNVVVLIPEDFSVAIESMVNATVRGILTSLVGEGYIPPGQVPPLPQTNDLRTFVTLQGDPGYQGFGAAQSIFLALLDGYVEGIRQAAAQEILSTVPGAPPVALTTEQVSVQVDSITGTREASNFSYFAPGIMIFGLLLSAIAASEALAREVERKTLARLKISMMSSFDLLFGSLLPWALFAGFQVLILFGVALALGYDWSGGYGSILLAIGIGCIVGIACVALGMLLAAFARNTEHASSLGTLVAVPMSFVVGVFIGFPPGLFTQITAFLPWRQGLLALLKVLSYGSPMDEVVPNITALIIETAVLFALGVIAFSTTKLRPE